MNGKYSTHFDGRTYLQNERILQRRTVLKSLGAASIVTAGGLVLPTRRAKATTVGRILSVHYDGNTSIQNDGTIQGFPATSSDIFIAYTYLAGSTTPNIQAIVTQGVDTDVTLMVGVTHNFYSAHKAYLSVGFTSGDDTHGLIGGVSSPGSLPISGYHTIMIQSNTTTGLLLVYLDSAPLPGFSRTRWTMPFQIPYYTNPYSGAKLKWRMGNRINGNAAYYIGEKAEFFLVAGHAIDVTNANYRQAFVDAATGLPTRQGDQIIVYDSNFNVIDTITPQIRLWGGADTWLLNSPNWTTPPWSWTNPPVSKVDNGPNAFYVAAGALQTTSTLIGDPWGNTGEV